MEHERKVKELSLLGERTTIRQKRSTAKVRLFANIGLGRDYTRPVAIAG